jgi:hypothetical protein
MRRLGSLAAVAIAAALAAAGPALAEDLSREDLLQALKQRDEAIAALEKRVAALESAAHAAPVVNAAPPATAAPSPVAAVAEAASGDDEAALQAISRGLIERGLLLLPTGAVEVTPTLSYSYRAKQGLALVDTPEGISTVTDERVRDDSVQALLGLRLGLPWSSQLDIKARYGWMGESQALGDGTRKSRSSFGLGDVELALSHQFLAEGRNVPTLIGALTARIPTGADPFRTAAGAALANGEGTYQAGARVTALKSIDPMVLFASLSYATNLARRESYGRVHPGDEIALQVGASLAVSPSTSFSVSFLQDFRNDTIVDKATIAGSDQVASVLQFGLDQVLTRNILLDVTVGVGVTRDAPDYVFAVSLPVRFR